ncbi:MAG TPA: site-2 protease family protein [Candidatus Paenalcaligenes intestinipullorum]|uniref:Site-2 protease family protein n=1 Tax=Candidatus Paenalcaligenes intestinipullorum TaxID=2838718 RepID=A0A9D2RHF2_9BURK|nr:site-2 protease family protein [Candidatus Paenalcaligenes intestinipullorum]
MSDFLTLPVQILLYSIPIITAITLHEVAHGYVARLFGDDTAQRQGRITLNPIKHIDPVGTLLVPLVMYLMTLMTMGAGLIFGWAKPVPVDASRMRNPKQDMFWVALAGPASNLIMMVLWALLWAQAHHGSAQGSAALADMAMMGIRINIILMALNLLPIPPLDGSRMVSSVLPHQWALNYARIEPYGFFILILLMISGYLGVLMQPFISFAQQVLTWFL